MFTWSKLQWQQILVRPVHWHHLKLSHYTSRGPYTYKSVAFWEAMDHAKDGFQKGSMELAEQGQAIIVCRQLHKQ